MLVEAGAGLPTGMDGRGSCPDRATIVNVCQKAHVSLVLPRHSSQVTPGPYSNVTTFHSLCLGFEVLGYALSM